MRKRVLTPPIEKLRGQFERSRALSERLRAELAEAEQLERRDREALAAAEARRLARRSPGYRAFRDAERAMRLGGER